MSSLHMYFLSVSLQVAGGLILLLWSFTNTKEKVIKSYFPGSNIAERNEYNMVCLDKKKLQKTAKDIYINRFAFAFLTVGYGFSIFGDISYYNRWYSLFIIIIMSITWIFIAILMSTLISIICFRKDEYIDFNSLENVDTFATDDEIQSINEMFK